MRQRDAEHTLQTLEPWPWSFRPENKVHRLQDVYEGLSS